MSYQTLVSGTNVLADKANAMSILSQEDTISKLQQKLVAPLNVVKYTDVSEQYRLAGKEEEFHALIDGVSNQLKNSLWKLNKAIGKEFIRTFPNH